MIGQTEPELATVQKEGNLFLSRKQQQAGCLYPPHRPLLFYGSVQQLEKLLKNICWFEK